METNWARGVGEAVPDKNVSAEGSELNAFHLLNEVRLATDCHVGRAKSTDNSMRDCPTRCKAHPRAAARGGASSRSRGPPTSPTQGQRNDPADVCSALAHLDKFSSMPRPPCAVKLFSVCDHPDFRLTVLSDFATSVFAPRNYPMQFFSSTQSILKAFHDRVLPTAQSQTDQAHARRPVRQRASPLFSTPAGWANERGIISHCPTCHFSRFF